MQQAGQLFETYTRGVGLAGDIGTIVAVTHHAGSGVTPGTYYVHNNHRGDVIITRSGTTTVGVYEYSAFGNLKSSIGNDVCRFKFSSKELDRATGFYYYGYRFYAPQWQRWISPDPIKVASMPNWYCFAENRVPSAVDLYGLILLDKVQWLLGKLCPKIRSPSGCRACCIGAHLAGTAALLSEILGGLAICESGTLGIGTTGCIAAVIVDFGLSKWSMVEELADCIKKCPEEPEKPVQPCP